MSRGPLLYHPGPMRLCRLPDAPPAGVSGCSATWRDAASPPTLLRQVRSVPKATINSGHKIRHVSLNVFIYFFFRYLCDRVVPGNRVTIMGIYSIKKMAAVKAKGKEKGVGVGIRASYLRVVGIQVDTEGAGKDFTLTLHICRNLQALVNFFKISRFLFQVVGLRDQCLHRRRRS